MTTPNDIISRALKDIGALEAGETPTAEASQDAFDMLQDMLDQWSNEDMMVFYKNEIIFPVVSGRLSTPSAQVVRLVLSLLEALLVMFSLLLLSSLVVFLLVKLLVELALHQGQQLFKCSQGQGIM